MGEINLRFRLEEEDYINFNKVTMRKGSNLITIIFILNLFFLLYLNIKDNKSVSVSIVCAIIVVFVLLILRPFLVKSELKKAIRNHFLLRTETTVEFYQDHIVEKNEGGETNIRFESHFPLEAIKKIIETNDLYLFFISPIEAIILPKRVMGEEDFIKMNNLITNLFSNRYQRYVK